MRTGISKQGLLLTDGPQYKAKSQINIGRRAAGYTQLFSYANRNRSKRPCKRIDGNFIFQSWRVGYWRHCAPVRASSLFPDAKREWTNCIVPELCGCHLCGDVRGFLCLQYRWLPSVMRFFDWTTHELSHTDANPPMNDSFPLLGHLCNFCPNEELHGRSQIEMFQPDGDYVWWSFGCSWSSIDATFKARPVCVFIARNRSPRISLTKVEWTHDESSTDLPLAHHSH